MQVEAAGRRMLNRLFSSAAVVNRKKSQLQPVREVIVIRHAFDEAGDEFDGLLYVAQVGHFHDGVHVAGAGRKSAL